MCKLVLAMPHWVCKAWPRTASTACPRASEPAPGPLQAAQAGAENIMDMVLGALALELRLHSQVGSWLAANY